MNVAGLFTAGLTAVFARRRRRAALLALWPWTLSILACVAVFVVGMIIHANKYK